MRRTVLGAKENGLEATISRGRAASPTWDEEEFEPWAQAKVQVSRAYVDDVSRGAMKPEWVSQLPRDTYHVLLTTSDTKIDGNLAPTVADHASHLLPAL